MQIAKICVHMPQLKLEEEWDLQKEKKNLTNQYITKC